MSDQTMTAPPEKKGGFRLPSAYTILFALIVAMAIATWLIPAGLYDLDKEGARSPARTTRSRANPSAS